MIMNKQKHITSESIKTMEKQKRVHLINSLGGFKSVALVGTVDIEGNPNVAVFSSVFHVGANPPLIGLIFRPAPPERNTFNNIMETGFTRSIISMKLFTSKRIKHQRAMKKEFPSLKLQV